MVEHDKFTSMDTHSLGNTGLPVTRMGLGLAALGRPGYVNLGHSEDLSNGTQEDSMERRTHAVLEMAWNAGVRYFDAARSYGLAEKFLASWLVSKNLSPGLVTVGSKWGYIYTAGWKVQAEFHEIKNHSISVLKDQWRESVSLLDGHVRLYQIHSATIESGVLVNSDVLTELARMKSEGIHIGLTLSGAGQTNTLRKAIEISLDGVRLFETVQATWNLLEKSVAPALLEAKAAGLGVILKEGLANGRLTDRNQDPGFRNKLELLRTEAERLGSTPDALALAVCLAQPFADVVLSGAATEAQLRSNLRAATLNIDQSAIQRMSPLAESPDHYWSIRKQLPWN